jgi:glycosyltransferase involved in cell wall biosynthesis
MSAAPERAGPSRPLVLLSSLAEGGAERVTVSFLGRLARDGVKALACTVASRQEPSLAAELRAAGVARHDLAARRLADPAALPRLLRLLWRERIDLIHAHGQDACILAAAARRLTRVPLVLTRHVLVEPAGNWRQGLRARLALAAARRADAVIAVSQAVAERLALQARLPPSAIRVIPNAVDLERFRPCDGPPREAMRAALGLATEDVLVLVPAVLREGKGHEVLIEALPVMRAGVARLTLAFAGSGEREAALRERARSHGEAIRFLGPRHDMPALLAACDLVVLPSLAEALPTALIEAAAAGRAAVATRVGGCAEVVDDGRTGVLVPPGDAAALAAEVVALLLDRDRRRAFEQAARRRAEQRFSLDLQVSRTLDVWHAVAASP